MRLIVKSDRKRDWDYLVEVQHSANVDALGTLATNITGTTPAPAPSFVARPIVKEIPITPPASSIQSNITEIGDLKIKVKYKVDTDVDRTRHHTYVDTKSLFSTKAFFSPRFAAAPGPLAKPDISILVLAADDDTENNTLAKTISQTVQPGQYSAVVYLRRSTGVYASPFRDNTPTIPVDSDSTDPVEVARLIMIQVEKIISQQVDHCLENRYEDYCSRATENFRRAQDSIQHKVDRSLDRGQTLFGYSVKKRMDDRSDQGSVVVDMDRLALVGPQRVGSRY